MTEALVQEIDRGLQPLLRLSESLGEESRGFTTTNKYLADISRDIEGSNLKAKTFIASVHDNLHLKSYSHSKEFIESLLHGEYDSPLLNAEENEALKQHLSTKYPFKLYKAHVDRVKTLAQELGFENETQFRKFIEGNPSLKDKTLVRIFKTMGKWADENKSFILLSGLTLGVLVPYLQKYNRKNSGCFRYRVGQISQSLQKEVYLNRFCQFATSRADHINDTILEDVTHPLSNARAWDCNFNIPSTTETQNILSLGCNGICNPHNYNLLIPFVQGGYIPVDFKETFYMYRCEQGTFLRNVAEALGDGVGQVVQGIGQSNVLQFIPNSLKKMGWIILILIIVTIFAGLIVKIIVKKL